MAKSQFKKNQNVGWKWLGRVIKGHVQEIYFQPIERTIKNKKIKRNGSSECPAYLVVSEAGNEALKLETELVDLTATPTNTKTKPKPKMFG